MEKSVHDLLHVSCRGRISFIDLNLTDFFERNMAKTLRRDFETNIEVEHTWAKLNPICDLSLRTQHFWNKQGENRGANNTATTCMRHRRQVCLNNYTQKSQ